MCAARFVEIVGDLRQRRDDGLVGGHLAVEDAQGIGDRTTLAVGPIMAQSVETRFRNDLSPISVKGSGKVQGMDLVTDLTYANGRVKGTTSVPGAAGINKVAVDTTVATGAFDINMISALIPGLRWVPGAKYTFNAFDPAAGTTKTLTIKV